MTQTHDIEALRAAIDSLHFAATNESVVRSENKEACDRHAETIRTALSLTGELVDVMSKVVDFLPDKDQYGYGEDIYDSDPPLIMKNPRKAVASLLSRVREG